MTSADLLASIDTVDTSHYDLSDALSFLRLVVRNNPRRGARQMAGRPDVTEALEVIATWLAAAESATATLVALTPTSAAQTLEHAARATIESIRHDTSLDRLGEWWASEVPPTRWADVIIMRMQQFKEWLQTQAADGLAARALR